jgi:hypothetical protein
MANVGNPASDLELGEVKAAAHGVVTLGIAREQDIVPAFEKLNTRAEALYV